MKASERDRFNEQKSEETKGEKNGVTDKETFNPLMKTI